MTNALNPGLEDVAVAETRLTRIDGETGQLHVRGYPTDELAGNATYEETVFLLLSGRLPTTEELAEFRTTLSTHREVGEEVLNVLRRAAHEGKSATYALRMGVAAANLGVEWDDSHEEARRVIAVLPAIVAAY